MDDTTRPVLDVPPADPPPPADVVARLDSIDSTLKLVVSILWIIGQRFRPIRSAIEEGSALHRRGEYPWQH